MATECECTCEFCTVTGGNCARTKTKGVTFLPADADFVVQFASNGKLARVLGIDGAYRNYFVEWTTDSGATARAWMSTLKFEPVGYPPVADKDSAETLPTMQEAAETLGVSEAKLRELMGGLEELEARVNPSFEEIGRSIGALVARKNAEYGDATVATAQMLEVLYPDGVPVDAYRDLLLVTRVLDKLCRITRGNQGEESAYMDLAGYGILGVAGHDAR